MYCNPKYTKGVALTKQFEREEQNSWIGQLEEPIDKPTNPTKLADLNMPALIFWGSKRNKK